MTRQFAPSQPPRSQSSLSTPQLLGLGSAGVAALGSLAIAVGSLLPLARPTSFLYTYNHVPGIIAMGLLGAGALAVLAVGLAIPKLRIASALLAGGGGLCLGVLVILLVMFFIQGDEETPAGAFTIGPGSLVLLLGAALACVSGAAGFGVALWEQKLATISRRTA